MSFSAIGIEDEGNLVVAAGFDGNLHVWKIDPQKYIGSINCGTVYFI